VLRAEFSEYETNIKRREGFVIQTHMGKKTEISRLFMVRGGTLKMMPSRSQQTFLKFSSLINVRYSQMRSRCQLQTKGLTGSRMRQAFWTKTWSVRLRTLGCSVELAATAASRPVVAGRCGRRNGACLQLRRATGAAVFLAALCCRAFAGFSHWCLCLK